MNHPADHNALYTLPAIAYIAGVMALAVLCVFGASIQ
jgi:hypothetical protein